MYKKLSASLLHTRGSFTEACKLLELDPEWVDPAVLDVIMCDNCSYWDLPKRTYKDKDGTNYCFACHDLETRRF